MDEKKPIDDARWALVTTPGGVKFFGQVRSREFDPVGGGMFVKLFPGYSYELLVVEEQGKQKAIRSVGPIDGINGIEEVETFAISIAYFSEGDDLKDIIGAVARTKRAHDLQQRGKIIDPFS